MKKGVDELISSFINADIENLSLYIVGNGPQEKFVNKKYENNKIKFLGYQDHKNTLSIIKNAKAVVTNTKMYEGQPTLLCEASLLSVPAIFPRNGGIEEFFSEKYPLSFSQSHLKDLEHVLGQLSDYDLDDLGQNFFITKKLNEHDLSEQLLRNFLILTILKCRMSKRVKKLKISIGSKLIDGPWEEIYSYPTLLNT